MGKTIESYRQRGRHISPSVDQLARVLFALLGGILLLAPLASMAYITAKRYLILSAVLFVLLFAIVLALTTTASNQELAAATAAYAAVLVVFVGSNIPNYNQGTSNVFMNGTNVTCPGCWFGAGIE
jgi:peptidoglycan/LPS O-acetylase OafA/YrhL